MSVLIVGMSHKSAPVAVLEQVARDSEGAAKLIHEVGELEHVVEATVLATCNRIEVYAEVDRFHGSVEAISRLILEPSTETDDLLVPHLYVHYDDAAVSHLFHVASGLELLDTLSAKPTDTNDNPVEKIRIKSIRIVDREKAGI